MLQENLNLMNGADGETGVPGLKGVDHVGISVPDLSAAVEFYTQMIGGVELFRVGPLNAADFPRTPDGRDWTEAHLNVPGAKLSVSTLKIGANLLLELIQYDLPLDRRTVPPLNSDWGSHHVALAVSDIDRATNYLRERGLRVMDGPVALESGPSAGVKWVYFLDPWGNQMELIAR
ncbi:MAG TPA: VOC family protein [Candidatus Angelobacter sp.]|nr:VOC family protein [Candidatus Angelobacter sp.]